MYDPAHVRSRTVQPMGDNLKLDLTLKTRHVLQDVGKWLLLSGGVKFSLVS